MWINYAVLGINCYQMFSILPRTTVLRRSKCYTWKTDVQQRAHWLFVCYSSCHQGSKFPPVRLPGTSRFSVGQPKTLSPLALWANRFWVQLLVKRCQPKAMISFISTVGLVSCRPFQPFPSHFHLLHPPQLCNLTENAHHLVGLVVKASASRAGGPRFESR